MNRAPSKNDRWWPEHKARCNGEFIKVHEPEGFQAKGTKKKDPDQASKSGGKGQHYYFIHHFIDDLNRKLCCMPKYYNNIVICVL